MCGGRRTGTWLLTSALWPSWVPDLELISSEGRAGQAAGWFVQKSCLTPQPGSTPRKELCLLHLCALSPGCAPQAWPAGNFHGCQARAYRPGAPLLSAGTGKRWGPALNTFGVTALRSHGSGFPRGRSPFPANLSLWPQHHLLEIPQHDTRVAGNVFRRDCPRRGVLELESPPWAWGSLGEGLASSHVNRLAVSLTPSKAYCTLLLAMFLNHSLAVTSPPPKPPPHYLPPSKSLGLRYPPPGWKSLMVSMAVGPSAVTWTCPPRCVFHFLGQAPTAPLPQLACERLRPRGEHGPLYNIVVPLSHSPFWLNHPGSP